MIIDNEIKFSDDQANLAVTEKSLGHLTELCARV